MAIREVYDKDGNKIAEELHYPAPQPTEAEKTAAWMSANPEAVALIMGLNRPTNDPLHIPVAAGLTDAEIVDKIVANKAKLK